MQALRVDWRLSRPVVCRSHELHLDSLLAWARVQEAGGDWTHRHDLPLERDEHGGDWVFKAGIVHFVPADSMRMLHMVRRTDPTQIALDGAAGVVNLRLAVIPTGSGPLKGYSWHTPTQLCSAAVAWCVGDIDRVTELLYRVRSLGKLGRNGFGEIAEVSVNPAGVGEEHHWAHRAFPSTFESSPSVRRAREMGIDFAVAQGRAHPPYWDAQKSTVLEPIGWRR